MLEAGAGKYGEAAGPSGPRTREGLGDFCSGPNVKKFWSLSLLRAWSSLRLALSGGDNMAAQGNPLHFGWMMRPPVGKGVDLPVHICLPWNHTQLSVG